MKFVIDSSVAVKWVLMEVDSDKAERLREDFKNSVHDLLTVDIFKLEASHAFTRAERQGRIAIGEAKKLLVEILTTPPRFSGFDSLLDRAIDISSVMRVGVYDCLYVALAEQEKCKVVTADTTMVNSLQAKFPFIIALSSLP